jgi:formate hydrogenlyase subunit 3/multisubunit Na+/H+ antiporter MnhD subunit
MVPAQIEALATLALAAAALLSAVGAVLAIVRVDHRAAMIAATAAAAACAIAGIGVISGPNVEVRFGVVLGYSLVDLRFDALSGVFLVALGGVGIAASLYGISYHDAGRSRLDTLALGFGGPVALGGLALHLLAHGLTKASLFVSGGGIVEAGRSRRIARLSGSLSGSVVAQFEFHFV